jgi:hypothetical protein
MAKIVKDTASVTNMGDGLLSINYDQFWDDGDNMGGVLVCEASAAGWLAGRFEAAAEPCGAADVDQAMPPDHFLIFVRGGEHGEDTNVHVHNRRNPGAPRGRTYTLSGISPGVARSIAARLRAIKPQ